MSDIEIRKDTPIDIDSGDSGIVLDDVDINQLSAQGFTIREIEKLKGESKSSVARKINKED